MVPTVVLAASAFIAETGFYEIHAPSASQASGLGHDLDHAALRFRLHFGANPRRIAVVAFESVREMREYDPVLLNSKGVRYVPWLLKNDALDGSCDVEPARLAESAARGLPGRSLDHEAGHAFLSAHVDARLGRLPAQGPVADLSSLDPGDAIMPDWFEEAAAALCEMPESRTARLAAFRRRLWERYPLHELFTMRDAGQGRDGLPGGGAARHRFFVDQSFAVAAFLVDREGPSFIGRLSDALTKGRATTQALRDDAPSLPADVDELERLWISWVEGLTEEAAGAAAVRSASDTSPLSEVDGG